MKIEHGDSQISVFVFSAQTCTGCLSYKCHGAAYLSGQMNHSLIGSNELSCLSLFLATATGWVMVVTVGEGPRRDEDEKSLFFTFFPPFTAVNRIGLRFSGAETKNKTELTDRVCVHWWWVFIWQCSRTHYESELWISFSDITADPLLNAVALTGLTCS